MNHHFRILFAEILCKSEMQSCGQAEQEAQQQVSEGEKHADDVGLGERELK
jgi:hypothetical protein